MITRAALDRLTLTAIAKISYIVSDFEEAFESEEIKDFPYQEISDAEILRQIQEPGNQPITPPPGLR